MYEREPSSRTPKRQRRRRKNPSLPLMALALAVAAFTIAFMLPPEEPDKPQSAAVLPVTALSASDGPEETGGSGLTPDPRGAEPSLPEADSEDNWNLLLVNPWNPLPEDFSVTLKELPNGHSVDERCYQDLQDMLDACRAEGLSPLICSSYRSQEKQESLYQNKVERLVSQGFSREDAKVEAAKVVAIPGTSEHQLGLAVDIVDVNNQLLNPPRRTPKYNSGSSPTAGSTASSSVTPTTRARSPA